MRRQADPEQLDFEGLRRQGIALLQDLSKGKWTDYNLHDPGVTLLELLCYGLTDLLYRTEFSVADFLTDQHGQIQYKEQALFAPQDVFPNQALTDLDFCKLIYDSLPAVDDVWITQGKKDDPMASIAGLFTVFIKPHESLFAHSESDEAAKREQLRLDVLTLLAQHRNLCRDVAQVHIVTPHAYSLAGEIEIDDSRLRTEIYADIYFQCAKLISCGSRITRFEEARQQGMTWEDIFDGPLTEHGYIDDSYFSQDNYDVEAIKLITLVRHIPGVKNVKSLYLLDEQGHAKEHLRFTHHDTICPVLHFPEDHQKILALRLVHGRSAALEAKDSVAPNTASRQSARELDAFAEQVSLYLKKFEFEHEAFRRDQVQIDKIIQLPQGQRRQFSEYTSLGEDTPPIYGINRYGVPKSEPSEVHARARQLKAYLYPFEQIMANYLASLQQIRRVYSLDDTLQQSYFAQFLEDTEIPNIEQLYTKQANSLQVEQILREQDNFPDRRNRVLDTLLAIYGEQFPEEDLRRYAFYHREQTDQHIILCKIHLLQHLCELSSQRGLGFDLTESYGTDNRAALQRRLQILIGNYQHKNARHFSKILQDKVQYLSHTRYKEKLAKQINFPSNLKVEQTFTIPYIPYITHSDGDNQTSETSSESDFELPHHILSDSVLRNAAFLENYHYYPEGEHHVWLCLINGHEEVLPICLLPKTELQSYALAMQKKIVEINQQCEGFHLLEHVLLRPRSATNANTQDNEAISTEDFYAHRVSIVLPGFTARFADKKCRRWIENLIAQHLPAHVLPEFYWLDFAFFAQFELRYLQWLSHLQASSSTGFSDDSGDSGDSGNLQALDESAQQLIEFIKKNRQQSTLHYWI